LWDDPLFNSTAPSPWLGSGLDDEEFRVLRREARLLALEILYIKLATLESSVKKWKEAAGRHAWVISQLLDRADIPREVLESINIEQEVNMMDPDFSFADWLKSHADERERLRQSRGE
jgi:hypothetical protein